MGVVVAKHVIRLASVVVLLVVAGILGPWWAGASSGRASRSVASLDEDVAEAAGEPGEVPETQTPRLRIRTLDAETGAPLAACKIVATAWGVKPAVTATGAEGEVEIDRLQGEIRAERRGYVPASFRLSAATALLVAELHRAVSVRGRVVHAGSGYPIEGASVEVTDIDESDTLAVLLSDRDGRFEIPGIHPARQFLVVARRRGMAPAGIVEPRADPDREIVLELGGGATLEGRVLRADDTPVPGAEIVVAPRGGEPLLRDRPDLDDYLVAAKANDQGTFRVEGLRTPAAYSATATDDQLGKGRVDDIELRADGESAWRDIRLASRTTLVIHAVFPPGAPPANPSINVLGKGAKGYNDAAFDLKEGGTYKIVVHAANWPETRLQVDVRGGVKNEVQVHMSRDGHRALSGRVVTETGVPLGGTGTSLRVTFTTPEGSRTTSPAADGTFQLCDVPSSNGRLEVRDDNGILAPWVREDAAPEGPPVKVVLRAFARFIGRVEPVPRSRSVVLHREYWSQIFNGVGTMVGPLPIEEDGTFTIGCGAGRPCRLAFEPPDGAPLFFEELPLAEGEARDLGILRFGPGVTVEARVLDDIGRGVADASILVDVDNLCGDRHARSDASGRFRLEHLGEMALDVTVDAPGFVAREFAVPGPRDLHLQEIALQPAGFVEGTLLDEDGRPLAGWTVDCAEPDRDDAFDGDTDSLGRFRIAAAPGTYRLVVGDHEGPAAEVRARETTRVEFRIKE